MQTAYERIKNLYGMEDFKHLADRLKLVAENKARFMPDIDIPLPHYMFVEYPGSGLTTHLHLFAQLLQELNLFMFQGSRMVVEQIFDDNMEQIIDTVHSEAGFYNDYHGIVGIELKVDNQKEFPEQLGRLIDYAEDKRGSMLFVFCVNYVNDEMPKELIKELSVTLPLEVIHFPQLSEEELFLYFRDFLKKRGFLLSEEADMIFMSEISGLLGTKGFDGLQSLDNMADFLIYYTCCKENLESPVISEDMLRDFFEKSRYIDTLSTSGFYDRHIGFKGAL